MLSFLTHDWFIYGKGRIRNFAKDSGREPGDTGLTMMFIISNQPTHTSLDPPLPTCPHERLFPHEKWFPRYISKLTFLESISKTSVQSSVFYLLVFLYVYFFLQVHWANDVRAATRDAAIDSMRHLTRFRPLSTYSSQYDLYDPRVKVYTHYYWRPHTTGFVC